VKSHSTRFAWLLLLAVGCSDDNTGGGGLLPGGGTAGMQLPPGMSPNQQAGAGAGGGGSVAQPPQGGGTAGGSTPVSGSGGAGTEPTAGASGAAGGGAPPGNCQGFSFEGLMYSPGGEVLPNTCEPFHPTTNNPYAVRCVDAWPWYETKYPGDEYCILPPPPDKGIQIGVHPQGKQWFEQVSQGDLSGYDNPPDSFVLEGGQEEEMNYTSGALNPQPMNFYRSHVRMRAGSHHMIVSTGEANAQQEVWAPGAPTGLFGGTGLPGAQRPDENTPKSLVKPTEDSGYFVALPAMPSVVFNMHHFNSTMQQTLKESWTNMWWEDDARIPVHGILGLSLLQTFSLNVQAGQTQDYHYSWAITEPIRLLTIFGHRHAWTPNFTSWIEKPGGETEILYQSFDWYDQPTYRYDSMTQNPPPAPEQKIDGGTSGIRMLNPGETFHFNCHITFTDERATAVSAPRMPAEIPNGLRFANQAFNAEMCILFGSTAAVKLPTPGEDASPLPDFATID